MAEKESSKEPITMSIWFILFLILLIFATAYIFMLHQKINDLELLVEQERSNTTTIQESRDSILKDLQAVIEKYTVQNNNTPTTTPNVQLGTYVGTLELSGDGATPIYTLTLSEENNATLSIANQTEENASGDVLLSGTYSLEDSTLTFNSSDGLSVYSFTVLEGGNLQYATADALVTLVRQ